MGRPQKSVRQLAYLLQFDGHFHYGTSIESVCLRSVTYQRQPDGRTLFIGIPVYLRLKVGTIVLERIWVFRLSLLSVRADKTFSGHWSQFEYY